MTAMFLDKTVIDQKMRHQIKLDRSGIFLAKVFSEKMKREAERNALKSLYLCPIVMRSSEREKKLAGINPLTF